MAEYIECEDTISKRVIQDSLVHRISNLNAQGEKAIDTARELIRFKRFVDAITPVEPKPVMTEEVREAIMRLTMCAREECSLCKYADSCSFDKQVEMATENMNTILTAFTERPKGEWIEVVHKTEQYDREGVKSWAVIFQCPKCGFILNAIEGHTEQYNFCPNCGADMRGDKE